LGAWNFFILAPRLCLCICLWAGDGVFFSGEILPYLDKKIENYFFSSVNLTKFATFLLNLTKLSISKNWKKKHYWGVEEELWSSS
jgi:hypothetical protein